MSISKELLKEGKKHGICQNYRDRLKYENDKEKLVEMYIDGIQFCLEFDYPSNEYIRKNFAGVMEKHGVHLDEHINVYNEKKVVALGKCTGRIEVNGYSISEIFVKHDSEISITAIGNSFVMVDAFDNARVKVFASENAKVVVNLYGNATVEDSVSYLSAVKVIHKFKKTY